MLPIGLILLVAVAVFLNGVIILVLAIRGKGVVGSLVCAGCGFDVLGIPDESVCPECGSPLGIAGAAAPRRTRSKLAITAGVLLTVLPFVGMGAMISARASGANLYPYAPFWLLVTEAENGTPTRASAALAELAKRMKAGSLSHSAAGALVEKAVLLRTSPRVVWNTGWSDIIEQGRIDGMVSDAQWVDYVHYSIVPISLHRKAIRRGADLPVSLTIFGTQLGTASRAGARARIQYGVTNFSLSGREILVNGSASTEASVSSTSTSRCGQSIHVPTAEGEYKSVATYSFRVLDPEGSERVLGSWVQDFDSILTIEAADATIINTITNDGAATAIRGALSVNQFDLRTDGYLSSTVNAREMPMPVAFEAFARLNGGREPGRKISLGSLSFSRGAGWFGYGIGGFAKGMDATSVDLILSPAVSVAEQTVDMDSVWIGPDIVIPDIPVRSIGDR